MPGEQADIARVAEVLRRYVQRTLLGAALLLRTVISLKASLLLLRVYRVGRFPFDERSTTLVHCIAFRMFVFLARLETKSPSHATHLIRSSASVVRGCSTAVQYPNMHRRNNDNSSLARAPLRSVCLGTLHLAQARARRIYLSHAVHTFYIRQGSQCECEEKSSGELG